MTEETFTIAFLVIGFFVGLILPGLLGIVRSCDYPYNETDFFVFTKSYFEWLGCPFANFFKGFVFLIFVEFISYLLGSWIDEKRSGGRY